MRYVASYLLAALGGNSSPSAKDIKKILDSVGIEADDDRLNKVISELNGKNIKDVTAQSVGKAGQCACWWGCGRFCSPWLCSFYCWFCPCCSREER